MQKLADETADAPVRILKEEDFGTFPVLLLSLSGRIEEYLEQASPGELTDEVTAFYFRVTEFQGACGRATDRYLSYARRCDDGRLQICVRCMDPSADLQECMDRGRAAVLFSATLLPVGYYRSLLSGRQDDYAVYASSSFDPSRRRILIGRDVSTLYRRRSPEMYRRIAAYIRIVTRARSGNYMVFFPSYRMMEETADVFEGEMDPGVLTVRQESGMSEERKEEFLSLFSRQAEGEGPAQTLIGFCVMGSVFSEGIDLRYDSLIGVIVAGTGLPQVGEDRELLKSWFDRRGMDGFFYAYTCPGFSKVMQAAGRVIRTEKDRGVIVLLDERFTQYSYRKLFPREWSDAEYVTLDNAAARLEQFWDLI